MGGRYGCKRFLRDGYRNPKEDSSRLHYEPWELRVFENIECQWPMFFCYAIINGYFSGNYGEADQYAKILEGLLVDTSHGLRLGNIKRDFFDASKVSKYISKYYK